MYPFSNQPHQHYQPPPDFPPSTQQPQQQAQQHSASSSQQSRDRDQSPLPHSHRNIGAPLNFSTGQFSGKHVRAELIELQKADLGRKYVSTPRVLSPTPSCRDSFTRLFLQGTLARTADPSIHHPLYNLDFSTRILVPTDPIPRLSPMS